MAWYNNVLVNSTLAILFGAMAVAIPTLPFMASLPVTTIILFQIASIVFSASFLGLILTNKNQAGLISIIGAFALIITGFMIASNVGSTVPNTTSVDYVYDSNFNGTFTGDMVEQDSYLTVSSTGSGTFTSEQIYESNGTIEFNRLSVDTEQIGGSDNVDLRVRTYEQDSLVEVHTYDIQEAGISNLNVSEITSMSDVNSFDYRLSITDNSDSPNIIPEVDSITFETEQTEEVDTNESGIVSALALLVFVMGGIMVAVAGLT